MPKEKMFVVYPDRQEVWDLERRVVSLNESISSDFAQGVRRKVDRLFDMSNVKSPDSYGLIGFSCNRDDSAVWSVEVKKLPMECPWDSSKDGVLGPAFESKDHPVLALKWTVPANMRILLVVVVTKLPEGFFAASTQFVVAVDQQKRMYQLPLSNLYIDMKLCHGIRVSAQHKCSYNALMDALNQFEKSRWNADLFHDNPARLNATQLFRFKATEKGFDQLPPTSNWTGLAVKCANEFVAANITNLEY